MSLASAVWFRAVLALLVMALLSSLGFWQLDRARQKRELHELFLERFDEPALDLGLHAAVPPAGQAWRAAHASGRYEGPTLLLDNRIRNGRVGYEVLTAFTLADGQRVLVDRGWVPAGATRDELPALTPPPVAPATIRGRLAPPPSTGIDLGSAGPPERVASDVWRVQHIDFAQLAALSPPGFLPVLLYLDATEPGGYDRAWLLPAPDDGKHTAYAVQWFTMAGVVAVIFLLFLRRRRALPNPTP
jgi:surfeit locus 1 family protein